MSNVVYFLGAGFSAPFGIPTMANFIDRAKDMFASDPDRYEPMKSVFKAIKDLAYSNQFYAGNQNNIEEILSILDMRISFESDFLIKKSFDELIRTVIRDSTPILPAPGNNYSNWHRFAFASNEYSRYGYFIASLLNLVFTPDTTDLVPPIADRLRVIRDNNAMTKYSVITTNYDTILETFAEYIRKYYCKRDGKEHVAFKKHPHEEITKPLTPLAKLHGCIEEGTLVPPTFSKSIPDTTRDAWTLAYNALTKANEIRIIGYSLPESDSYLKYLFKSTVINCEHLKKIDVICLDPTGETKKRYDKFILTEKYRFADYNSYEYMNAVMEHSAKSNNEQNERLVFNKLEDAHSYIMGKHLSR